MVFTLFCIQKELKISTKVDILTFLVVAPLKNRSWPKGPQFETIRHVERFKIHEWSTLQLQFMNHSERGFSV